MAGQQLRSPRLKGNLFSAGRGADAVDDFPARHAWLIAQALAKHQPSIRVTGEASDASVPLHPGAAAYFSGHPLPSPEPATEADQDSGHAH
jgi:hypothetical protein